MIFTFYSFKGGVGRSMALANIARWFELQGLRVVLIDWDLEAPGLENFFVTDARGRVALRAKLGVIDLLTTYKDIFPSLPKPQTQDAGSHFKEILGRAIPPLSHVLIQLPHSPSNVNGSGGIWLLPAGCRDEQRFSRYAETVQQFNWADFYTSYEGHSFFEWMRLQLNDPKLADVVLIDSRTGFAEMSGVCTRHLADVVVVMSAPNDQNLEGVAMMAESFVRPDVLEARGGRPIRLIMTGARVDATEGRPVDLFNARFHELLDRYEPVEFSRLETGFAKLRIPYVSTYAYSEKLAVGEPDGVKTMQDAYANLATHMALLSPPGSAVRQKCLTQLRSAFIHLSEAEVCAVSASEVPLASPFATRLEGAGVFAQALPDAVRELSSLPETSLRSSKAALVLLVTTACLPERFLRALVQSLRSGGIRVFLVLVDGPADAPVVSPPGLGQTPTLRLEQDFDQLTRLLQIQHPVSRVPYLAPPPPPLLVGRERELNELKSLLSKPAGASIVAAVVGLGGAGKSSLVRALCDDNQIIDTYPDGILWAAARSASDLQAGLAKWVAAFEGESTVSLDADETERRLSAHLTSKSCLIVLDDLVDGTLVQRIPRGPSCAILLTTPILDVALTCEAQGIEIGALTHESAVTLALAAMPAEKVHDAQTIDELVSLLGHFPLTIRLAASLLRSRAAAGQDMSRATHELTESLKSEGLDALGEDWQSTVAGYSAAIEHLPSADRLQLRKLATLPPEVPIPLQTARDQTSLTSEMALRLASLSLILFNASAQTVTIPSLTHAYLRTLAQREQQADLARMAGTTPTGVRIYISYRRENAAQALRIANRLSREYGPSSVFLDTQRILPGEDWQKSLRDALAAANVALVLIGREWLLNSRLADPEDLIHRQIRLALEQDISVIPLLLDGVAMPSRTELPEDIAPLTHRVALELNESRFNQGLDRLVAAISQRAAQRETPLQETVDTLARAPSRLAHAPAPRAEAADYSDAHSAASAATDAKPRSSRRTFLGFGAVASTMLVVGGVLFYWHQPTASLSEAYIPGADSISEPSQAAHPETRAESLFSQAEDLYFGRTGPKDFKRALQLYYEAANLGFAPAENAVGRMFEYGEGVPANSKEAIQWYSRAAKQGHPDATAALNRLTRSAQQRSPQRQKN